MGKNIWQLHVSCFMWSDLWSIKSDIPINQRFNKFRRWYKSAKFFVINLTCVDQFSNPLTKNLTGKVASFPVRLPDLRIKVTDAFWTSVSPPFLYALRLISDFCLSGYDFVIPSFRLHLTLQILGIAVVLERVWKIIPAIYITTP